MFSRYFSLLITSSLIGLACVSKAQDAPALVVSHEDENIVLPITNASIRFYGDPCTCRDRGGSGLMRMIFSTQEDKPSAFIEGMIGPMAASASMGNPSIRVYMQDKSVWVANRLGHTSIISKAGDPGIDISDYECRGDSAKAVITINGELVYTPNTLTAMLGPFDSDKRAEVTLKKFEVNLQRSLLKSESCGLEEN